MKTIFAKQNGFHLLDDDVFRTSRKQKASFTPELIMTAVKNDCGHIRVGVVAGKVIGNAVTRNRSKRMIRAIIDRINATHPINVEKSIDIIFIARKALEPSVFDKMEIDIDTFIMKFVGTRIHD